MSLRIMRKGTVRELNIPAETVAIIEEIKRTLFGNKRRNSVLKDVLGHSVCSMCSDVPSIEVSIDVLDGFRKVEYYCSSCASNVYEKEPEPEDKHELAAKYGCVIGKLPETPGYK